jgi:hypothetical protein
MKVMVTVKATKESEAGMMPDEKVIAEMGKFKEELCLRLHRGCGVRGRGRDGLGTGRWRGGRGGAGALVLTALSDDPAWDHESLRLLIERVAPRVTRLG